MGIIEDTAHKMNVEHYMVFDMWGAFQSGISIDDVDKQYERWYYEGKISPSVQSFCLDILTSRIPLVALPTPKQKARKKKGD